MAKEEETQDSQSTENKVEQQVEKDLSVLNDITKFKEASTEDQEAFLKQAAKGTLDTEDQDSETSEESDEDSEAEEKNEEPSDKEQPSDDKDSQSSSSEDTDNENKEDEDTTSSDKRLSKLEKSYKSLEAEFTRRSQKLSRLDDEVVSKDARIRELEAELKRQKGQADKGSILDKVREKNPDAALLLSQIQEEAVEKARSLFEEELKSLKSQLGEGKVKENRVAFQSSLDEFMKSPLAALEPELLEIINSSFSSEEELAKAVGNDPELFRKLKRELLDKYFDKAAKLATTKSQIKPDEDKKRDAEIQSGKGAGKSRTSSTQDVSDPDNVEYFKKLPPKKQVEYLKRRGLYR